MFTKTLKLNNGQPLHCPFCGFMGASFIADAVRLKGVVVCDGCEASSPAIDVIANETDQALFNRALHSWNERTNHATNSHPDRPLGGLRLWSSSPMPAQVFIQAVHLASLESNKRGQHEEFESIKLLCEWWNTHAPNKEYRCAGYFKVWVKAWADEDADIKYYRNADLESPVVLIEDLSMNSAGNAAVGEPIVLEFMKGCQHFTARGVNNDFIQTYNVTGAQNDSVDSTLVEAQSGERDEAWHAYKALLSFPTKFPAVWAALLDSIKHPGTYADTPLYPIQAAEFQRFAT